MPSTRRRFLTGVTAVTGALAGCNESRTRAIEETMTPVEVPRTDRELLEEARAVDVPAIPPAVVVDDRHLASAIGHVVRLREALLEAASSRQEPIEYGGHGRRTRSLEETAEDVGDRIDRAREAGPSREALDVLRGALREAAVALGYVRAEAGELTVADVEAALEEERSAVRDQRDELAYRVATPVAEHLPTLYAAEENLHRIAGRDGPKAVRTGEGEVAEEDAAAGSRPEPTPTPEPDPGLVAERYHHLQQVRLRRENVERYLETATDDGAPSVRAALESELSSVRAELAPIADEYRTEERATGDGSVREGVRGIRWSVGSRIAGYLSGTAEEPPDGDLVRLLFDGVRQLVSFRSVDAGVELTLDRLDGRRFPTDVLPTEKRRAVDRVEAATGAPALGRAFAETAPRLLRSGDRSYRESDPTVEDLARVHVHYVGGGEWAARGVSWGESIAASLRAQQS